MVYDNYNKKPFTAKIYEWNFYDTMCTKWDIYIYKYYYSTNHSVSKDHKTRTFKWL